MDYRFLYENNIKKNLCSFLNFIVVYSFKNNIINYEWMARDSFCKILIFVNIFTVKVSITLKIYKNGFLT